MALNCNREAFKLDAGCPPVSVDLKFPDFGACEDADPGRLKGVSRLDLQKSPAFPMFMPAEDPLPISIPDLDIDYECPLDGVSSDGDLININAGNAKATGNVRVERASTGCSMTGISIDLDIPDYSAPKVRIDDGAVYYTFSAPLAGWF